MALDQAYLASLGLEIAKKKYYNAAKVEDVVEAFCRREAALKQEKDALAQSNETLRGRLEALSFGREEIGDAILSAKTISQHLIGEARDKAEALTAESVESADALITAAQEKADRIVAEARARADALVADAEARRDAILAESDACEQNAVQSVQTVYQAFRAQALEAVGLLDREWQRFLCSLGDGEAEKAAPLPEDLSKKLGALAEELSALEGDGVE